MKTGTIVLGICSSSEGEREAIDRCVDYLVGKGRRNVRPAFYHGTPDAYDVMKGMFLNEGIDTFCILPICIAEGDLTVWRMPKALTLPDNSGSWTKIGDNDVATRFATALGFEYDIAESISGLIGEPANSKGALVIAYGSKLSQSEKTAAAYVSYLRNKGWIAEYGFTRFGRTAKEAAESLISKGCKEIDVIPLMISADGRSFRSTISDLQSLDCEINILEPITEMDAFYRILDEKVPEGW